MPFPGQSQPPRANQRAVGAPLPCGLPRLTWHVLCWSKGGPSSDARLELFWRFVSALVDSRAARFAILPGDAAEREPDISDELGYRGGVAGGSGFYGVDFDRWV